MNTCKHCGFNGEPEEFRIPNGSVCKECFNKRRREQRKNNHDQVIKQEGDYRKKNREKINKKGRDYYKKNRKQINKQRCEQARKYYQENKEKIAEHKKKSYQENHEKELEKGRIKRRKNGILPWTEIKHLRLGLYIEQTIAAMFGVPTEAFGNPDVDFICPNGYKMQIKAASITYNHGKYPRWSFPINKNKVVDYFILVAVNNTEDIDKEDFKPAHIWMMKGDILNDKTGTSVSPSRISKWDKYSIMERYENKFVACCNIIKKKKKDDDYERI